MKNCDLINLFVALDTACYPIVLMRKITMYILFLPIRRFKNLLFMWYWYLSQHLVISIQYKSQMSPPFLRSIKIYQVLHSKWPFPGTIKVYHVLDFKLPLPGQLKYIMSLTLNGVLFYSFVMKRIHLYFKIKKSFDFFFFFHANFSRIVSMKFNSVYINVCNNITTYYMVCS